MALLYRLKRCVLIGTSNVRSDCQRGNSPDMAGDWNVLVFPGLPTWRESVIGNFFKIFRIFLNEIWDYFTHRPNDVVSLI